VPATRSILIFPRESSAEATKKETEKKRKRSLTTTEKESANSNRQKLIGGEGEIRSYQPEGLSALAGKEKAKDY